MGLDMGMFPGLSQEVAESKRVRREQLRRLIKDRSLDSLYDELLPGEKVMKAIDASLSGGNDHVAAVTNDTVELFDEWVPQSDLGLGGDQGEIAITKVKPAKGEAWGLSHHLLKLLQFMIALRLRKKCREVHVYNLLYLVLKYYRSEGKRVVGMHYAQQLFDTLHKKSWWTSVGTLENALKVPHKDVLESLRNRCPRMISTPPIL